MRHRLLGLYGAADLTVRTGGPQPEVFEWPNVLFIRSQMRRIEHLLHSREFVEGSPMEIKPGPTESPRPEESPLKG